MGRTFHDDFNLFALALGEILSLSVQGEQTLASCMDLLNQDVVVVARLRLARRSAARTSHEGPRQKG